MTYKLTLLKDLPKYPAGTIFYYEQKADVPAVYPYYQKFMGTHPDKLSYPLCIPEYIIDDPKWIKKEICYDHLIDLKCPTCGETRGEIIVYAYRDGDRYDGYTNCAHVYFQYACGHKLRQLD